MHASLESNLLSIPIIAYLHGKYRCLLEWTFMICVKFIEITYSLYSDLSLDQTEVIITFFDGLQVRQLQKNFLTQHDQSLHIGSF